MNSIQRKAARKKRALHQLKRAAKSRVKAICTAHGVEYDHMEVHKGRPLIVWDKQGQRHAIQSGPPMID